MSIRERTFVSLALGALLLGVLGCWLASRRAGRLQTDLVQLELALGSLEGWQEQLDAPAARQRFERHLAGVDPELVDRYSQAAAMLRRPEGLVETEVLEALEGVEARLLELAAERRLDLLRWRGYLGGMSASMALLIGLTLVWLRLPRESSLQAAEPLPPSPVAYTTKLLRSISNILVVIDPDSRIQAVNQVACEVLGYSEAELLGKPFEFILAEQEDPPFDASFRNVESTYRTRSGERIPVLISCSLLSQEEGQVQSIVTSAQDISIRRRTERELEEANTRLHQLLDRLAEAREAERRAVARDLHDGLLQYLLAAQQHLRDGLDREGEGREATEDYRRCLERLEHAAGEGRRVVQNLRPAALEEFGLVEALRLMLDELKDECGWEVGLDVSLDSVALPDALETAAYRILQEALNNARRHARTESVAVSVRLVQNELRLMVQDWGRGFDPAQRSHRSVGLDSMRERAELLGGWCRVSGAPGRGTRVEAALPFNPGSGSAGPSPRSDRGPS